MGGFDRNMIDVHLPASLESPSCDPFFIPNHAYTPNTTLSSSKRPGRSRINPTDIEPDFLYNTTSHPTQPATRHATRRNAIQRMTDQIDAQSPTHLGHHHERAIRGRDDVLLFTHREYPLLLLFLSPLRRVESSRVESNRIAAML